MDIAPDILDLLMGQALDQARLAAQSGEVPTGAVIAQSDGRVVSVGRNQVISLNDPTAHAEILALRAAAAAVSNYRLSGLWLISTLEPCAMCLMAAIHSRLDGVIFGAPEPKWGALGSTLNLAALPFNHRISAFGGLRAKEAAELMRAFFSAKRKPN